MNLLLNACEALPATDRAVRLSTRPDGEGSRRGGGRGGRDPPRAAPAGDRAVLHDEAGERRHRARAVGVGGIVKEHGGRLEFRSAVGAGTTARLVLPGRWRWLRDRDLALLRILLVDDEPAWLRSLSLTLERAAGFNHLLTCDDPRRVLEILDGHDVGVVLLDVTMPHVSGEDLLARIGPTTPTSPSS